MADGVRAVAALEDPIGEELERKTLESGLDLRKVRVPLGVVAVVYEARPNVTVDCAALTIKSGNAIVLRGSHYAERSNGALAARRPRGAGRGRPARGRRAAARRRRPRGAGRARHPGPARRPADPARRRRPEGGAQGRRHRAGHLRGRRQLPRLRPRRRRPRDGAADRRQRQGPAPGRLQRGGDPARRRGRRRGLPARSSSPTSPKRGSSWSATSGRGLPPAASRSARRARRTGPPSSST